MKGNVSKLEFLFAKFVDYMDIVLEFKEKFILFYWNLFFIKYLFWSLCFKEYLLIISKPIIIKCEYHKNITITLALLTDGSM